MKELLRLTYVDEHLSSSDNDCYISAEDIVAITPFTYGGSEKLGSVILLSSGVSIRVLESPWRVIHADPMQVREVEKAP